MAFRTASAISPLTTVGYHDLRLRVAPPADGRTVSTMAQVVVRYGSAEHALPLPIQAQFLAPVRAEPPALVFSAADPGGLVSQRREVALTADGPMPKLELAECPPWLRCEVIERDGSPARLDVELTAAPPEPHAETKIVLADGNSDARVSVAVRTLVLTH